MSSWSSRITLFRELQRWSVHRLKHHRQLVSSSSSDMQHGNANVDNGDAFPEDVSLPETRKLSSWAFTVLSKKDFIRFIKGRVIFENDDIVAINKPNGLAVLARQYTLSHPSILYVESDETLPVPSSVAMYNIYQTHLTLAEVLPDLQKEMNCPYLQIAITLPSMYSGVVICAKSEAASKKIRQYLATVRSYQHLYQKFHCLTLSQPSGSASGQESRAYTLAKFEDGVKTIPADKVTINLRKKGQVVRSTVHYNVLDTSPHLNCSLLELQASREKWSFLEWYCSTKLCSVLGDHVYSHRIGSLLGMPAHIEPHFTQTGTQKVPEDVLKRLSLRQDQVELLPLHIHRSELYLERIPTRTSPPLRIHAAPPGYFLLAMKRLLLSGDKITQKHEKEEMTAKTNR